MTEIFVALDLAAEEQSRLRAATAGDQLHLVGAAGDATARAIFKRCDVVFGNPPADWIAANPALKWVQLESVGFGEYAEMDWQTLGARLRMTNLAGFFTEPVAESILAGLLALYRGIDRLTLLRAGHDWQGDAVRPHLKTLKGARVVLFGFGSINGRVAELLAPFECVTTAFRSDWTELALDEALRTADIVISSTPHTPRTRDVFSRERLGCLKPGAMFLNFGRGSVVDEDALADLLDAGTLAGAVIDVTRDEPLPTNHRFWRCPNLILTQHTGGGTGDEIDRKIRTFRDNLGRYKHGEPLVGLIDFSRGY